MTLSLGQIPSELLMSVQMKMCPISYCRLRQTCRKMDDFFEKNRFRSKVFCARPRWMLVIAVGEKSKPGFNFEITPFKYYVQDAINTYNNIRQNNSNVHGVMDPYKQLSGMRFENISLNYYSNKEFFKTHAFKQCLLTLLNRLQLQCKYFTIVTDDDLFRHQTNVHFQCRIDFICLQNFTALTSEEYRPLKHLKEHDLGFLSDVPSNLSSMIRHLKRASLKLISKGDQRNVDLLEDFLEEVCKDKSKRGNLEYLVFETGDGDQNIFKRPESLSPLFKGATPYYERQLHLTLYQLKIDGGIAMIQKLDKLNRYFIHFFDEFNRDKLIHYVLEELVGNPFDLSAIYEAANQAPDDKTAIEILCENYYKSSQSTESNSNYGNYFNVVCILSIVSVAIYALKMTDE